MLFVSTPVSQTVAVFPTSQLVKCGDATSSFVASPIAKKVVVWILSAFSRICYRLNVCVLNRLGCLTLIHEND